MQIKSENCCSGCTDRLLYDLSTPDYGAEMDTPIMIIIFRSVIWLSDDKHLYSNNNKQHIIHS